MTEQQIQDLAHKVDKGILTRAEAGQAINNWWIKKIAARPKIRRG